MLYQQAGLSSRLRASGVLVYCNVAAQVAARSVMSLTANGICPQTQPKEGARPLCLFRLWADIHPSKGPRRPSTAASFAAVWLRFATRETGHQIYVDAPFPAWSGQTGTRPQLNTFPSGTRAGPCTC